VPFQPSTTVPTPTAVQAVADVHDTPLRPLSGTPLEFGVDWIDQAVPFHRSAKVCAFLNEIRLEPTAVQAVGDVHDTALNLTGFPVGLGVVSTDQLVPFQPSAKVTVPVVEIKLEPTAVQAVADVHETPLSVLDSALVGLGVVSIDQLAPFQRSANDTVSRVELELEPTAVQAVADVHETELRRSPPVGLGVLWIDQSVPFQRSANVASLPTRLKESPTAVQAVLDVHDTPTSWLSDAPLGFGVVSMDQLVPFQCSANIT
jgi:hypothetical protein